MCGRITQYRGRAKYAEEIGWGADPEQSTLVEHRGPGRWGPDRIRHYNLPPGLYPDVMHTLHQGKPMFDTLHWGYRPQWAVEQGIPMATNARIEKAVTGRYFRHMWRAGRIIVPADGWYEWTGEKGHKQPWYIRLKGDRPMFLAAVSNFVPYKERPPGSGFVIVTAAAEAGLVDVHDRRPVVLAPVDARLWMDNTLNADQAEQRARSRSLPPDAFEWYRVSTDVNNARNNDEHLIEPI